MSGKRKIFKVLKEIKRESEINSDPEWVKFEFNNYIVGAGILSADEERRILTKLEKEGIIEIHLPYGKDDREDAILSGYTPIEFMNESGFIILRILPKFYKKYLSYSLIPPSENAWNLINPFWLTWQATKGMRRVILWLWNKNKVIASSIGLLAALLVYDWSLAWQNTKAVISLILQVL